MTNGQESAPKPAPRGDVPDQPVEVLKELLRETRRLTRVVEKARKEQRDPAAEHMKALKRIRAAAEIWMVLVLPGIIADYLFGNGLLGGY
jgi:hypothetical protein